MKRTYVKRRRAEREDETRRKIVEATVSLHETKGGLRTTISDVAELAGVERATVYRHFPDDRALFTACIGHYAAQHPPPDPASLSLISDPEERLRAGLTGLYAFYGETESMTGKALRDLPELPVMGEVMAPLFDLLGHTHRLLLDAWPVPPGSERIMAAVIAHAMSFWTWQSLVREQRLTDAEAIEMIVTLMSVLASDG